MRVTAISNSFYFSKKQLDTKVVEFGASFDCFNVNYSENSDFVQKVRLHIDALQVTTPVKERVYRETSGNFRNANVFIDKKIKCTAGYFDENIHEAMGAALKHETLLVDSVQYFSEGEYEINGKESSDTSDLTQANFTLNKQGYNLTNQSC